MHCFTYFQALNFTPKLYPWKAHYQDQELPPTGRSLVSLQRRQPGNGSLPLPLVSHL